MWFVIHIDDKGRPGQLDGCSSFDEACKLCAKFASANGVRDRDVKEDILLSDQPGVFFSKDNTDASGVWVIEDE